MKGRAYEIVINPEYGGYQRRLASMIHIYFFYKMAISEAKANVNEELAQELQEPVIKKIQKKESLC